MKFCYVDESGTGDEPYAVMVGIIVDTQRMNLTKKHWKGLLSALSEIVNKPIEEIHTRDFYPGNGPWRELSGDQRSRITTLVFKWLQDRKHNIVFSAVNKSLYRQEFKNDKRYSDIHDLWCFMALHLSLSVQKYHQTEKKNKGHTVLIFDNEETSACHFERLILNPPAWTHSYYGKTKTQEPFDQIVDAPYFADSKSVGLLQVADFVSYFIRRYVEIKQGAIPEKYKGEKQKMEAWMTFIRSRTISKAMIYPTKARCECAELFWKYGPDCLK